MQELINLITSQVRCVHQIYAHTCTYCRVKAAPRRTLSPYNRTTSAQLTAIVNLAQAKQRSLPANITSWSVSFASRYIKFLISLPFPREILPRLEQFGKEHIAGTDIFRATHKRSGEYFWNDGMTKPVTLSIIDADTQDLVDGVVKKGDCYD